MENEPERIPYKSQHVDPSQKEEKTQVVFITLTTLFVVIVICCIIEVYRTNRAHRKRIERETDESIIWSKEQATKLFESPNAKAFNYKPVSIMALNGILLLKLSKKKTISCFIHHVFVTFYSIFGVVVVVATPFSELTLPFIFKFELFH